MAFSRALGVFSIVTVSWFAAVGCGDDDDQTQQPSAAGEGGEAGQGGATVGGGGSSPVAGTNAGAGDAGMSTGGTAGEAGGGVGGQLVDGGAGGAGGEPPVAPMGGAAGEGGAGGEGPVPKAKQCAYQCEDDDDCVRTDQGTAICNPVTKRCEDPLTACSDNEDCVPFGNFLASCDSAADCDEFYDCVEFDGTGFCAPLVDSEFVCSDWGGDPVTVAKHGATGQSTVCVYQTARCDGGACIFGCADPFFGGCEAELGIGTTCNESTGHCECASSNECTADGGSVCGTDSRCGCADSTECVAAAVAGQTTCVASTCGCADAQECPDGGYMDATPVCE
jgi:hypothetical protein